MTESEQRYRADLESWPEERLRSYQLRKLRRVLQRAYRDLPFYRRRFDEAGIHPSGVKSLQDFSRIPTFAKRDVLREVERRKSFSIGAELRDPAERAVLCMTSGTLGSSFLYLPEKWRSIRGDSLVRFYQWGGLRPGMRVLMAAPAWHGLAVQESRALERLGATCVVPWGTFLPHYAGNFLDAISDLKPEFICMFLPMLYALLAECRRRGMAPRRAFASVKHLVLVGAPLTPRSRALLEEELGIGEIYEGLGNPEALTAMECSFHCGHHVFMDCCYVEVVHPRTRELLPPGKRGTVVITSLIPHGTVYLRYDSEDVGEILPQSCKCGRTWPLLEVYDRWANAVRVGEKEIFPYDVRLCLEEAREFVGVPFALVRGEKESPYLKMLIQKPAAANLSEMENRLRVLLRERLGVEATAQWTEQLPERWKGVAVIDETEKGAARV